MRALSRRAQMENVSCEIGCMQSATRGRPAGLPTVSFIISLSAPPDDDSISASHMINRHKAQFSHQLASRAFSLSVADEQSCKNAETALGEYKQNFKKLLFKYANARWLALFGVSLPADRTVTRLECISGMTGIRSPAICARLMTPSCKLILVLSDARQKLGQKVAKKLQSRIHFQDKL